MAGRSIRVTGLPDNIDDKKLQIFFSKRKNGGGPIQEVAMQPDDNTAIIIYQDIPVANQILSRHEFVIQEKTVKVRALESETQCSQATENDSENARTIIVSNLPRDVSKNAVKNFFQNKKRGGEVEQITLLRDEGKAIVTFKNQEVAESVASKTHKFGDKQIKVSLQSSEATETDTSESEGSKADESTPEKAVKTKESVCESEPDDMEISGLDEARTIVVSNLPINVSEQDLFMYFQKKANGGGELADIPRFIGKQRKALITFEENGISDRVLEKKHVLKNQEIDVKKYVAKPKKKKVDFVFSKVTALVNYVLVEDVEAEKWYGILDQVQDATGAQWYAAAHGFLFSGTLEQVTRAKQCLLTALDIECSPQSGAEQTPFMPRMPRLAYPPTQRPAINPQRSPMMPPNEPSINQINYNTTQPYGLSEAARVNFGTSPFTGEQTMQEKGSLSGIYGAAGGAAGGVVGGAAGGATGQPYVQQPYVQQPFNDLRNIGSGRMENPSLVRDNFPANSDNPLLTTPRRSSNGDQSEQASKPILWSPLQFRGALKNEMPELTADKPTPAPRRTQTRQSGEEDAPRRTQTRQSGEEDAPRRTQTGQSGKEDAPRRTQTGQSGNEDAPRRTQTGQSGNEDAPRRTPTGQSNKEDASRRQFGAVFTSCDTQYGTGVKTGATASGGETEEGACGLGVDDEDEMRAQPPNDDTLNNQMSKMSMDDKRWDMTAAEFALHKYKEDIEQFKSRYFIDVHCSSNKQRLLFTQMRGFNQSDHAEIAKLLKQLVDSVSKNFTCEELDLSDLATSDNEKAHAVIAKKMGKSSGDAMVFETQLENTFLLVGDSDSVRLLRQSIFDTKLKQDMAATQPAVVKYKCVHICLRAGEIEREKCQAIVNFTDKHLSHEKGLAHVIRQAAGEKFWRASRDLIASNGELIDNMVVTTTAGDLPSDHVIHAVLASQKERKQEVHRYSLQKTCRLILEEAKQKKIKSLCFPVLTPDLINLPTAVGSRLFFTVVKSFIDDNNSFTQGNAIDEIRMVYKQPGKIVDDCRKQLEETF